MESYKEELRDFVLGMAIHDAAKPFFEHGPEHAVAGYILLSALGKGMQALPALLHHINKDSMALFFDLYFSHCDHKFHKLPSYLLFCSTIDLVASSVYGFMQGDPPKIEQASIQNPFSRIPVSMGYSKKRLAKPKRDQLHSIFWEKVKKGNWIKKALKLQSCESVEGIIAEWYKISIRLESLADKWQGIADAIRGPKSVPNIDDISDCQKETWKIMECLQKFLGKHPSLTPRLYCEIKRFLGLAAERDYPPANDTRLINHCRLTAALAYVTHSNLAYKQDPFLKKLIQLVNGDVCLDTKPVNQIELDDILDIVKKVAGNLSCHVLRISFSGYRSLVENSSTLDDFHGAMKVLEYIKTAFTNVFAEKLGVAELSEFLVITESLYDFVYLIPGHLLIPDIESRIHESYINAIDQVIEDKSDGLVINLNKDLERMASKNFACYSRQLSEELQTLPIGFKFYEVSTNISITEWKDFFLGFRDTFTKDLANGLKEVMKDLPHPHIHEVALKSDLDLMSTQTYPAEDICEVCGVNPVDKQLQQYAQDAPDAWQKVFRSFRGEAEGLCISCIARRVLSHKEVTVEALQNIISLEGQTVKVQQLAGDGFPDIPPLMVRSAPLEDYVDLGAAFVRKARGGQSEYPLDIFPTLAYAADRNSNIALIEIRPNPPEIYSDYSLDNLLSIFDVLKSVQDGMNKARISLNSLSGLVSERITHWFSDRASQIVQDHRNRTEVGFLNIVKHLETLLASSGYTLSNMPELVELEKLTETLASLWNQDFSSIPKTELHLIQEQIDDLQNSIQTFQQSVSIIEIFRNMFGKMFGEDGKLLDEYFIQRVEEQQKRYQEVMRKASAHFARILHRIDYVNQFFGNLPGRLEEHVPGEKKMGIRVLPIETRYPRCLLAVPVDRLMDALKVIWESMARDLLSSTLDPEDPRSVAQSVMILKQFIPKLLLCSVVIFKHKQPLYMVLSISENVIKQLSEKNTDWRGAIFGFTDARGAISERSSLLATSTFAELPTVLDLTHRVSRIALSPVVSVEQRLIERLIEWDKPDIRKVQRAQLRRIGKRRGWSKEHIKLLQEDKFFQPTFFLITAERR